MNYKKAITIGAMMPLIMTNMSSHAMIDVEAKAMMDSNITVMNNATIVDAQVLASAEFLAEMGAIVDRGENTSEYNFEDEITRREMLKVMMNISGKSVIDTCDREFNDMDATDWGCKYAEAALAQGFIAANAQFRPNERVTEIEALKMIMQAKGIERDENDDWRAGYESKAMSEGVISESLHYDNNAVRSWIFTSAAKTYPSFVQMMDEEMGVEVGGAMMVSSKNIVENASASGDHTTLVTAVVAAGLDSTLMAEGPFTVFAPTNDAFAKLPDGTVNTLLREENKSDLTDILTYHVVAGSYLSTDITDGLELTTVNGEVLIFTIVDGKVMINGNATVEIADARSSNGVTHVIDSVLLPSE